MTRRSCMQGDRLEGFLLHEFFVQHLPYRLSQLLALRRWEEELRQLIPSAQHRRFAPAHVEATALMARAFLNLLGVSYAPNSNQLVTTRFKDDDLRATDLGGRMVDLNSLNEADQDILKRVLYQANKATAHITFGDYMMDGWQCLPRGVDIVYELLRTHLYEPAGYPMLEVWKNPEEEVG